MVTELRSTLATAIHFEGTVTLAMRLQAPERAHIDDEVREVARTALVSTFLDSGMLPGTPEDQDAICPGRWRCFAAFASGLPVHHTFVSYESLGPVLYRVATISENRGQGWFRRAVAKVAYELARDGECVLFSKVGIHNAPSIAAHKAIGFEVVRTRRNVVVLGWAPRKTASRMLRKFFPKRRRERS